MTKVKCSYLGNLNCEAIHLQSGSLIRTDAPLDHFTNMQIKFLINNLVMFHNFLLIIFS